MFKTVGHTTTGSWLQVYFHSSFLFGMWRISSREDSRVISIPATKRWNTYVCYFEPAILAENKKNDTIKKGKNTNVNKNAYSVFRTLSQLIQLHFMTDGTVQSHLITYLSIQIMGQPLYLNVSHRF